MSVAGGGSHQPGSLREPRPDPPPTELAAWPGSGWGETSGGTAICGLVEAAGLAAGVLLQVGVARGLGPADYGRFAALSVVELVGTVLLSAGVPQALRHLVSRDPRNLREAIRWVVRIQLPLSVGVSALMALGASPLGHILRDQGIASSVPVLGLAVAIRCGLLEPSLLVLNGAHRYLEQAMVGVTYHFLRVAGVAGLVGLGYGLPGAITGLAFAATLSAVLAFAILQRLRRGVVDAADDAFGARVRAWSRLAPGYELLTFLLVASNLWVVKALVPDSDLVGVYAACFMTARAASALGRAATDGTFAPLSAAFARGRLDTARAIVAGTTRAIVLLVAPALALTLVRGESLIRLMYGPGYGRSGSLCTLLFAGACGVSVMSFYGGVLGAAGALPARLYAAAALSAVGAASSITLARIAGTAGAAWALLLIGITGAGLMALLVRIQVGAFVPWRTFLRALGAVTPMAVLMLDGRIVLGAALALGLLGYAVILLLFGEWTAQECRQFVRLPATVALARGQPGGPPPS